MTDLLSYTFFQNALLGMSIISIAAAIIGTYIVARRLVAISGGVTHACFGGLGLGYFLGIDPVITATLFAVGSSAGVEWLSTRRSMREDSAIAVVWALGMAIGIIFVFLTPGYVPELNSFLFGNVLTINRSDLIVFAVFSVVLLLFFGFFHRSIIACAFDRDFARVMHIPVKFITYAMTVFTAVCIVLTIKLVGVMLLMSMLALPQIIAELFTRRFLRIMLLSAAISLACCTAGLCLSAVINVPCSALIVMVMVIAYVMAALIRMATVRRRPVQ